MSETPERLCSTCKFCLQEDYGYSNYTTEGTTLACLLDLNPPLDGFEMPYGKGVADVLRFAETCARYVEGEGPSRDADCTVNADDYSADPEIHALLKLRWEAQP